MPNVLKVVRKRWRNLTHPFRAAWDLVQTIPTLHDRVGYLTARVEGLTSDLEASRREARMLHKAVSLPPEEVWLGQPPLIPGGPADEAVISSTVCREADFRQPWFSYWCSRLVNKPRFHRKQWEFVFICQGLWERGLLTPGSRGLGFGVGNEALPALFAAHGCEILGTDLSADGAAGLGWIETAQHAHEREAMRRPDICSASEFDRLVTYQSVDMNDVPPDLAHFDFCWSSCAFEHLGSIEAGLAFVENSISTLKPGGYGFHTTEFNVFSNDETVEEGGTVLFRRRDFEELERRLSAKGHRMVPLSFEPGEGLIDNYVDVPPFGEQTALKIAMHGYATTSFGLIVQRGAT